MASPLADRLRPQTLDEVVGQRHLLAPGKVLRRIIDGGSIPNLIFYGPPGIGKTTVANIIARRAGKTLCRLNGTTASTADLRDIVAKRDTFEGRDGVLLYLDEIQYLNKKQQQNLLEFIEDGSITLIASTTENPYFYVYGAVLSRCTVFEFKPVEPAEVQKAVERAFSICREEYPELTVEPGVAEHIALACGGDVRKALGAVEMLVLSAVSGSDEPAATLEAAKEVSQRSSNRYDRDGDAHYDLISALQKSIRGSDENAALHYLARLLDSGDLISPCRRILVTASEDIGLANGGTHRQGAHRLGHSAWPAGGPDPAGRGGDPAVHRPEVQHRHLGDGGGDGRCTGRTHRGNPCPSAGRPLQGRCPARAYGGL